MSRARRVGRRNGARTPSMRIVVVAEGRCTEPSYLATFTKIYCNKSVKVRTIGGVGDPRAVVERAIEERNDARRERLGACDSIWAMFDRDIHPRFHEAINLARGNGISLAISNPCFELWGIFHYEDQDAPIDRHQCQRRLGELCKDYARRGSKIFDDFQVIGSCYPDAVERARDSLTRRAEQGDPGGNPSSSVHCLTEFIRCPSPKSSPKIP